MTSINPIGEALLIFLLFIFILAGIILSVSAVYFRINLYLVNEHKKKIRERNNRNKMDFINLPECFDLDPEEIFAVTREEYERDNLFSAPLSPLFGYEMGDAILQDANNGGSGFLKPALN